MLYFIFQFKIIFFSHKGYTHFGREIHSGSWFKRINIFQLYEKDIYDEKDRLFSWGHLKSVAFNKVIQHEIN